MLEDDIPPEWMWPHAEALGEWFEQVRSKRKEAQEAASDDREQVPLMANEDPRIAAIKRR